MNLQTSPWGESNVANGDRRVTSLRRRTPWGCQHTDAFIWCGFCVYMLNREKELYGPADGRSEDNEGRAGTEGQLSEEAIIWFTTRVWQICTITRNNSDTQPSESAGRKHSSVRSCSLKPVSEWEAGSSLIMTNLMKRTHVTVQKQNKCENESAVGVLHWIKPEPPPFLAAPVRHLCFWVLPEPPSSSHL